MVRDVLLAAAAIVWLAAGAVAAPIVVTATPTALDNANPDHERLGALRYLGGLILRSEDARFGGLSGLVVDHAGHLTAVSDRGYWFEADLLHNSAGRLSGLTATRYAPMLNEAGGPVQSNWLMGDAEALGRDGEDVVVTFERRHRMWRYPAKGDLGTARPKPVALPSDVGRLPRNGGLESLAVLAPGRYLVIAEEPFDGTDASENPGWIVDAASASAVRYPRSAWKPADLARLPSGDILVLERRFSAIRGFGSRLKRIPATNVQPGALLEGEVVAEFEPPVVTENFEGLAVAEDAAGRIHLFMVSDDNFHFLQQTILLEFIWDPEAAP